MDRIYNDNVTVKDESCYYKLVKVNDVYEIYCKDNKFAFEKIRELLKSGHTVGVHNKYETFYGASFDWKMRNAIKDIECEIKVLSYNPWHDYPWTYSITPKKK